MKLRIVLLIGAFFLEGKVLYAGGAGALSKEEFVQTMEHVRDDLDTDVLSPTVIKDVVEKIKDIAEHGSKEQQQELLSLIGEEQKQTKYTLGQQLTKAIKSLLYSKNIQAVANSLAVPAITGALPGIGFQLLILSSSGATTGQAIASAAGMGAVMGVIDNLTKAFAEEGAIVHGASKFTIINYIKKAEEVVGKKRFLSFPGPLGVALVAIAANSFKQAIESEGGWVGVLEKFEWAGPVEPETKEQKALIASQGPLFNVVTDKLETLFKDQTVRNYLSAATVSTLQAAVVAMILYQLGLGYRGETVLSTLSGAGLRGALEGIFNYATYNNLNLGIISQSATGVIGRSLQKYITTGTQLALGDITPVTLHALATSAANQVIIKAGGWGNTVKGIIGYASRVKWVPYNPFARRTQSITP
jgi:hypothetical protein